MSTCFQALIQVSSSSSCVILVHNRTTNHHISPNVSAVDAGTYRLFSKAMLRSSSLSTVADHWLTESSGGLQASSLCSALMLTLDLRL